MPGANFKIELIYKALFDAPLNGELRSPPRGENNFRKTEKQVYYLT